jgi:hypothetical protein
VAASATPTPSSTAAPSPSATHSVGATPSPTRTPAPTASATHSVGASPSPTPTPPATPAPPTCTAGNLVVVACNASATTVAPGTLRTPLTLGANTTLLVAGGDLRVVANLTLGAGATVVVANGTLSFGAGATVVVEAPPAANGTLLVLFRAANISGAVAVVVANATRPDGCSRTVATPQRGGTQFGVLLTTDSTGCAGGRRAQQQAVRWPAAFAALGVVCCAVLCTGLLLAAAIYASSHGHCRALFGAHAHGASDDAVVASGADGLRWQRRERK